MKINIEASEETIKIVNKLLFNAVRNEGAFSDEEKEGLEKFRLDMILPIVVNSKRPLTEAFLQYYSLKKTDIPDKP